MKKIILFIVFASLIPIAKSQIAPVAVNDTIVFATGMEPDSVYTFNLLLNDFDPDGFAIEIDSVYQVADKATFAGANDFDYADSLFTIECPPGNLFGFLIQKIFKYRLRRIDEPSIKSNWVTLDLNPAIDLDFPVARNDTISGTPYHNSYADVLVNDYHPLDKEIHIQQGSGQIVGDKIKKSVYPTYYTNQLSYYYIISDTSAPFQRFDLGEIYLNIEHNDFYDSLDINNISALINCFEMQFWDGDDTPHFRVPKNQLASSLFNSSFWIGGLDEQDELHLAGNRYRQVGEDYWHGPVSNNYDSLFDIRWFHAWKLNRSDIEFHQANWWQPGYEPLEDILTWPGNGDIENGESEQIAPFFDQNGNGIYEPMQGDAPRIKGDQAVFFVLNDTKDIHSETEGIPLGIEIHAMAYAFDEPADSALWNTIFFNYNIINRSDTNYHDVYLGLFTDTYLGYMWDDRIECDVQNGMYFTYNGEAIDGNENDSLAYGANPPAQGIMLLGGPLMEPDEIDNPKYDNLGNLICSEAINGLGFGDGIVDNERFGMSSFVYFNGGGASFSSDPGIAPHYYSYMQSIWIDGVKLQYGAYGHPSIGSVGPECRYMFPSDTDPVNYGTYGLWPNGGYNQNGFYWSDEESGANPNDRRGLGSIGPFDLASGESFEFDFAYPWARAYDGDPWSSALLLKERAAYIRDLFENNNELFQEVREPQTISISLKVYPNPASDKIKVEMTGISGPYDITVFDAVGQPVLHEYKVSLDQVNLNIQNLEKGFYMMRIKTEDSLNFARFIKN
ncbi:MAG TPA: T9SS type A sorting domain-containing protein [Bacteroidales bacterium]|mgnify:CR=1 FL=1|nr:T9SS type A sorting domain-containing protein [Bacteroidales bacterium]HRX96795.1 T9SS type A sorting domain-containing protein [Bacteroidales bacterium]